MYKYRALRKQHNITRYLCDQPKKCLQHLRNQLTTNQPRICVCYKVQMFHCPMLNILQNCTQRESPPHIKPENNQKIVLDTSAFWSGCSEVKSNVTNLASIHCVAGRSFRSSRERWWYIAASRCKARDNVVVSQAIDTLFLPRLHFPPLLLPLFSLSSPSLPFPHLQHFPSFISFFYYTVRKILFCLCCEVLMSSFCLFFFPLVFNPELFVIS